MALAPAALARFRAAFDGEVVAPADSGYDDARRVWCALWDKRPALVARPRDARQVAAAIRFARDADLEIAIRCGGHSINGFSTCDDGLLLDLSAMRGVVVDADARRARASGGALLAEVDREAQAHGLVCPVGTVGHTGIGGLTLGGGVGRLQRPFGLTLDNLVAAEVVTADGRLVRTSEREEPELFWALRGAGANFGVVTAFEFRLHPFGPNITRGIRVYRPDDAVSIWQAFRRLLEAAPRRLGLSFVIARAGLEEGYPDDVAGGPIAIVAFNHTGTADDAIADLAPLADAAQPVAEETTPRPYLDVQGVYDESYAWGMRYYCSGGFADDLHPSTIRALVDHAADAIGDSGFSATGQGGAISDVPVDATAYAGRDAWLRIMSECGWTDPAEDEAIIRWCRAAAAIAAPELTGGRYVNEVFEKDTDPVEIYGRERLDRLGAVKRSWDPDNVFRVNHNIRP